MQEICWLLCPKVFINSLFWGTVGARQCRAPTCVKFPRINILDSSYYIQNESLVRDSENINLATDPPPDLVLEVEYSRSAVNKLTLYAAMGIPEFWRYNGTTLRIYILNGKQYSEVETSPTFGRIPVKEIPRFIQSARKSGEIATTRNFRTWVKSFKGMTD
jgi:Uma2 family endonuclease